ncbi:MAG: hypothetical protein H8E94_08920 [Alphaproteobacteria bacterium]|nr:hypothetical protein [Alphaproteobacteria bacterium]
MRIVDAAFVFVAAVFLCGPLLAAEKSDVEKSDNPHIQLAAFPAPALNSSGKRFQFPMTLIFEVSKETDVRRFCRMSPRIRDAVMLEVFKKPIKMGKGQRMDLSAVAMRLTSVANGALGDKTVVKTHVLNKVVSGRSGSANYSDWEICKGR